MATITAKTPDFIKIGDVNTAEKASKMGADVTQITPFNTSAPGTEYRADRALSMAELANLAYDNDHDVETKLKKTGFQLQSFYSVKGNQGLFNNVDTQCFVATKGDVVVLSFRGTDGLKDALTDVAALFRNTLKVGPRETQVHRGFDNALAALEGRAVDSKGQPLRVTKASSSGGDPSTRSLALHEEIKRLTDGPPRRKLYITGHSLGAGLATIAAFNLAREGVKPEAVYTVGSPRVGDPAFRDEYDTLLKERTFRHVNYSDIVTRVPFDEEYMDVGLLRIPQWASKLLGKAHLDIEAGLYGPAQYRHVGTEKYLTLKGDFANPPPGLKQEISDWVKSASNVRGDTVSNHLSGNYVKALKVLAEKAAQNPVAPADSFVR